ncbi:nickel pincer cofactor-dependent isomerase, group 22 [Salinifilum ghardaiensis]
MFDVDHVRLAGVPEELPRMVPVEQRFAGEAVTDLDGRVHRQVREHAARHDLSGKRIAVGGGSRGIAQIDRVVAAVVAALAEQGAKPFVVPAMGSHGGATAEGQRAVLAEYGITEEAIGAPVVAAMDTRVVAELDDGTPVHFDAHAAEADGIVPVNRVKPHTDFKGEVESGLGKMLAIGFGKHLGASTLHRRGFGAFHELVPRTARAVLDALPVSFGIALVENAYEQPARVELVEAAGMLEREAELLAEAKRLLPRLLLSEIDVLVVDEIGKDISGAGMDPNITGRVPVPSPGFAAPPITRIAVLGLTEHTSGNACGLGMADVTTQRCVDQIDFGAFYTNSLTSGVLAPARIPMALRDDRTAITAALHSCGDTGRAPKIARIRNTLALPRIEVSEGLAEEVTAHPDLLARGEPRPWEFDRSGHLPPLPHPGGAPRPEA